MAQVEFFMAQKDTEDFAAFLINEFAATFVCERNTTPQPQVFKGLSEISALIQSSAEYAGFLVVSPAWEIHPLAAREVKARDGRVFFWVDQRIGGPAFHLVCSRAFSEGDSRWIVPGMLSVFPWYIKSNAFLADHSLYETFDRPQKMQEAYSRIAMYVGKTGVRSICQEDGRNGPWIMAEALRRYEEGIWLQIGKWRFVPKQNK